MEMNLWKVMSGVEKKSARINKLLEWQNTDNRVNGPYRFGTIRYPDTSYGFEEIQ